MGIQATYPVYSEIKQLCIDFVMANHGCHLMEHIFTGIDSHIEGNGYCCICKHEHKLPEARCDILCLSPACQAFSNLRDKSGATPGTGPVEEHPLYDIAVDSTVKLILVRGCLIFILEEVETWDRPGKGPHGQKLPSPMDIFIAQLDDKYYIVSVSIDQKDWQGGSRPRIWCVGFSKQSFDKDAADTFVKIVDEILEFRRREPPTPLVGDGSNSVLSADELATIRSEALLTSCKMIA